MMPPVARLSPVRLKISRYSLSGRPREGVGSAIISDMTTSPVAGYLTALPPVCAVTDRYNESNGNNRIFFMQRDQKRIKFVALFLFIKFG